MADAAFVRQQQMLWGDFLGKFKGGMSDDRFSGFTEYQSELIGLDKMPENEKFIADCQVLLLLYKMEKRVQN